MCESAVTAGQSIHAQVTKTSSDDAGNDGDDEYFEDDDDRRWCLCVSVVLMKRSAESKWQVDRSIHAQVTQMSILVSSDRSCNSSRHILRYISPTAHSKSHCGKCKKKTLKITKITIFIDLNWCRKTWFFKMDWWVSSNLIWGQFSIHHLIWNRCNRKVVKENTLQQSVSVILLAPALSLNIADFLT